MTFACNNIDVQAVVGPGRYLLALPASLAQIQLGRVPAFIHSWLFRNKSSPDCFVLRHLESIQGAAEVKGGHEEWGTSSGRVWSFEQKMKSLITVKVWRTRHCCTGPCCQHLRSLNRIGSFRLGDTASQKTAPLHRKYRKPRWNGVQRNLLSQWFKCRSVVSLLLPRETSQK